MNGSRLALGCAVAVVLLDVPAPKSGKPGPESPAEEAAIAKAVDDAIGWFRTKDFDLLFRVHSPGPDLFLYQVESSDTIASGEAFRKFAELFRRPDFKYLRHEVKELRIHRARREDVAWFSARLDDGATIGGQEGCWKDALWTGVLEKRGGKWLDVQGHFSLATDWRAPSPPVAADAP